MIAIMAKFPFFDHAKLVYRTEEEVADYVSKPDDGRESDIYFFVEIQEV